MTMEIYVYLFLALSSFNAASATISPFDFLSRLNVGMAIFFFGYAMHLSINLNQ